MNIAICDDEKKWQEELKDYIYEYTNAHNINVFVNSFSDGKACYEANLKNYDIIFMDYQMNETNGIETAQNIRKYNSDSTIIFVSAFPQIAIDTFEVNTFRFLAKPIDKEKLFKALDDYIAQIQTENFIIFKSHQGTVRIKISDIIYAESKRNHTIIHTEHKNYEVLTHLKNIESRLPMDKFFRCHRAFITSFKYIKNHTNTDIYFYDNTGIFISRNKLTAFKNALCEYTAKYDLVDSL